MVEDKLSDKQMTNRERSNANLRPEWQPGQSGNPAGRPPIERCITSKIQEILLRTDKETGKTNAELVAEAMVRIAQKPSDTRGSASITKELLDRVEGKVKDTIEVEGGSIELIFTPARRRDG